jgi:hypothetical protein
VAVGNGRIESRSRSRHQATVRSGAPVAVLSILTMTSARSAVHRLDRQATAGGEDQASVLQSPAEDGAVCLLLLLTGSQSLAREGHDRQVPVASES